MSSQNKKLTYVILSISIIILCVSVLIYYKSIENKTIDAEPEDTTENNTPSDEIKITELFCPNSHVMEENIIFTGIQNEDQIIPVLANTDCYDDSYISYVAVKKNSESSNKNLYSCVERAMATQIFEHPINELDGTISALAKLNTNNNILKKISDTGGLDCKFQCARDKTKSGDFSGERFVY